MGASVSQGHWPILVTGVAVLAILVSAVLAVVFVVGMMSGGAGATQSTSPDAPPDGPQEAAPADPPEVTVPALADETPAQTKARQTMIDRDLRGRGIDDRRVLEAMARVPRHRFVQKGLVRRAYADRPLPIGHGQTISQPYIVALMTQLVRPKPKSRALDVGTGSGYQAAVLAELCDEVYGIEIVEPLAATAKERLAALGYKNATIRAGDGYGGWPEKAPFDVIVVAAAPEKIPKPLTEQLAPGGRLVIPVGRNSWTQELILIEKQADGTLRRSKVAAVAFVPMTGKAAKDRDE